MPKISRDGGPTYAGNEGVVRDARDELYTVNPVREGEEGTVIREPGDPNTDGAEQARQDAERDKNERDDERGRRNQQTDTAAQDQAQTMQDAKGGDRSSAGTSSKASSTPHGSTAKKN